MGTSLSKIMDLGQLADMIDLGYVRVQSHPVEETLKILNYTEKAQYEKMWNGVTEQCRGLIVDYNENVVIGRPWRKFYNLAEKPTALLPLTPCEITDKMDGSLGIGYYYRDQADEFQLAIATRGSFQSEQAKFATEWLQVNYPDWQPSLPITPLFEIIYPENRIVVNYGDFCGLVLLGAVDIGYGTYMGPQEAAQALQWPGRTTHLYPYTSVEGFRKSKDAQRPNAEGVVIRQGQTMVKIKQDDYVALHKLVTGLTERRVWEAITEGKTLAEICEPLPDEFHVWVTEVGERIYAEVVAILIAVDQELLELQAQGLLEKSNRKALAGAIANHPLKGYIFSVADGKDIMEKVLQSVKPAHAPKWGTNG